MSSYDKTRLLAAKMEGEEWPIVVGGVAESTWEIIPPEEWDKIKRDWGEMWLGPDWTSYDFVEIVVTIPAEQIAAMFDAREVTPAAVDKAPSA